VNWVYRISPRALKQLKGLGHVQAARIIAFLDQRISGNQDPRQTGKQLKGERNDLWRYRVGDYRILCQLQDEVATVLVVEVGHRREIYRR